MAYLPYLKNPKLERSLVYEKLPPPLITLLSANKPEIQYVALRNINLIVQKRPEILARKVTHFFVKYNDPIYVKMEKLEIIISLASMSNIDKVMFIMVLALSPLTHSVHSSCLSVVCCLSHSNAVVCCVGVLGIHIQTQVLLELKEYATQIDVEFVRKAVRAIGRCAIKLDKAAPRYVSPFICCHFDQSYSVSECICCVCVCYVCVCVCTCVCMVIASCVKVLLDLIQTKVNYVIQEAIIVIKVMKTDFCVYVCMYVCVQRHTASFDICLYNMSNCIAHTHIHIHTYTHTHPTTGYIAQIS